MEMKVTKAKSKEIMTDNQEYVSDEINLPKLRRLYNGIPDKKKFYEVTGITMSSMKYILEGVNSPTAKTIVKLAKYFNIPSGFLFKDYEKWHTADSFKILDKTYNHCLRIDNAILFYNNAEELK